MNRYPVFITARFCSGSTMLWNIFRTTPGYRAFYEPCHDNLIAHIHNTKPKDRHIGVDSYWDEYYPLLSQLERFHSPTFGVTRLLLESNERYDELERYLKFLIRSSGNNTPVLKFNRMDFRLPWLKRYFPEAKIIHLYRDPRDSWLSMVKHLPQDEWDDPNHSDMYDLLIWSISLAPVFPFLFGEEITNSYQRHYYIWRLSKIMGQKFADCSLDFQRDFQDNPRLGLQKLATIDNKLNDYFHDALSKIARIEPGRWREYRSSIWFEEIEARCDYILQSLGLMDYFGSYPLSVIRKRFQKNWEKYSIEFNPHILEQILIAYSRLRSDYIVMLERVRSLETASNSNNFYKITKFFRFIKTKDIFSKMLRKFVKV